MTDTTFLCIDEIWEGMVAHLVAKNAVKVESRVGSCTEVLGASFRLACIDSPLLLNSVRKLSPSYAAAELLWYLSGTDDVAPLLPFAPSYKRFAEADGRAHGAYGRRLEGSGGISNLIALIKHLFSVPDTRRGVVALWANDKDTQNLDVGFKDYPCTLSLQFLERRECLHMFVNMRSNDAWLGLPYDAFCFMGLQRIIAWCLRITPGSYYHNAASLHLYSKDAEAANSACIEGRFRANALFPSDLEVCVSSSYDTSEDRFRSVLRIVHELFWRLDGKPALIETVVTPQRLIQSCGGRTFLGFLAAMSSIPFFARRWSESYSDAGGLFEDYCDFISELVAPNVVHAIQHLIREDLYRNFERARRQ
jgi:thymidylate synthase